MPVPYDKREIVSTLKDATIKDGKLILKTELGWNIVYDMDFINTVDIAQQFQNGEPSMFSNVLVNSIDLVKEPKAMDNIQTIKHFENKNIIGKSFKWKDVMVGFVYGQPNDPLNYTWMLQFRNNQGEIVYNQNFDGIDIDANISTHSWNDGNWHGRALLEYTGFDSVQKIGPKQILLKGKDPIQMDGDMSILNDEVETIRLRYNIRTNVWYADLLDKKGEKCQSVIQFTKLASSAILHGHVDFTKPKPWVSYYVKKSELGHIMILGDTLIMHQKKVDK